MTSREIREHLGRVKPYYLRNDSLRALASAITGLRGIDASQQISTELRSIIREAVQFLARDQEIRKHATAPIAYQPGQERALLTTLVAAYKSLHAAIESEDHDEALARKIKLDQACNNGLKLLEQGKPSEADACFAEAVSHFKDEHRVFALIGKKLMAAGEVRRALPYLKKGVEVAPLDAEMRNLYEECQRLRDEIKA